MSNAAGDGLSSCKRPYNELEVTSREDRLGAQAAPRTWILAEPADLPLCAVSPDGGRWQNCPGSGKRESAYLEPLPSFDEMVSK